ncbi:MAG: stage III sporulation protein AA [Oscillospiraceae bacterium]
MDREESKLSLALPVLSAAVRGAVEFIPELEARRLQEIRLRAGKYLTVTIFGKEYFVTPQGNLVNVPAQALAITQCDIDETFQRAFHNSIHSFAREISQGFVTVAGGNRVGFCGTAVVNPARDNAVENVKSISSINIRVAREVVGCANEIVQKVFGAGGKSLLIAGAPSSGKTTVLRDLCRQLGETARLSVIDERCELAASAGGSANCDVGLHTDVFSSYTKFDGIMTAIRVMSPNYLVCDEIGAKEDLRALEYAFCSGVNLIATSHSASFEEAKRRAVTGRLLKDGVFDYVAVLGTGTLCGRLFRLVKVGEKT